MQIVLDVSGKQVRHPPELEEQLFRIVQQACENALAHAQAATLCIRGVITAEQVQLRVDDDGIGFDAGLLRSLPQLLADEHFGLVSMVERAESMGVELTIDSTPGRGTVVQVTWPASAAA